MRFDSYHPLINLIYFAAAISCSIAFNHPLFVLLSFVCALICAFSLRGSRALLVLLALLPLMALYTWWYSFYNHFGVTALGENFAGNSITAEALFYGASLSLRAGAVALFISCLLAVFTADKVVYLFGRLSPKLSLFIAILLRSAPRTLAYARRISVSQQGIGRGPGQGSLPARFVNALRLCSVLITWTLENFLESSLSMRSRGYSLRGRTAFSLYRFDNRDRSLVVVIFALLITILAGAALDQTHIYYDPRIIMMPVTALSFVFYAAYGLFLLLPVIIRIICARRFAAAAA